MILVIGTKYTANRFIRVISWFIRSAEPTKHTDVKHERYMLSFGCLSVSLYYKLQRKLYILARYIMTMKQRKVRVPYTNYSLPPSAEQGGQFVDFNKVIKRKKVKIVRKKKNANILTK